MFEGRAAWQSWLPGRWDAMWECAHCGTQSIAAPLERCPHCQEERDMPKVTRGGATNAFEPELPAEPAAAEEAVAAEPAPAPPEDEEPDLSPAAVRAWAAGQGIDLAPTGRIPKDVRDQHYAAVTAG